MKDKFARDGVNRVLEMVEKHIHKTEVRFCEKCKHETLQKSGSTLLNGYAYKMCEYDYICLNCGTEWCCELETVCTEVKKK